MDPYQIPDFIDYVKRIGYEPEDLNRLNVLHITGTKGKGSTSAFCSSMLTTLAPNARIGLYTSPHMVAVRERIRINGKPISEDLFTKYFFEVWDRFEQNQEPRVKERCPEKPAYFRYLTAMAFHVFMQEKVDATILEVGIGGMHDSTNIVPKPITTGISALGIDHVFVLGNTIEEIAAQKAGIYKQGVPALTVEQPASALAVLEKTATDKQAASLTVVKEHSGMQDIKLGLAGIHQRSNASLALALVQSLLSSPSLPSAFKDLLPLDSPRSASGNPNDAMQENRQHQSIPDVLREGLEATRWPGRCQSVADKSDTRRGVTWHLDGAHTVESLTCCAEWFMQVTAAQASRNRRVLVFNCTSGRSAESLLGSLTEAMHKSRSTAQPTDESPLFEHIIFCTNVTYTSGESKGELLSKAADEKSIEELTVQHELADAWKKLASNQTSHASATTQVQVLPSIQHAVDVIAQVNVQDAQKGTDVLVAGSLHLVGGVFEVADLQFAL